MGNLGYNTKCWCCWVAARGGETPEGKVWKENTNVFIKSPGRLSLFFPFLFLLIRSYKEGVAELIRFFHELFF